jgi:hypothetical protein
MVVNELELSISPIGATLFYILFLSDTNEKNTNRCKKGSDLRSYCTYTKPSPLNYEFTTYKIIGFTFTLYQNRI